MTAKTHSISFDEKKWQVAQQLAGTNTKGNVSQLLSRLIHLAALTPDDLGLVSTDGELPPTINEVIRGSSQAEPAK